MSRRLAQVLIGSCIVCVFLLVCVSGNAQTIERAERSGVLADSVGVNVHLDYVKTAYGNFDLVLKSLTDSGIRHIRTGAVDHGSNPADSLYAKHNALGKAGIRCDYVVGFNTAVGVVQRYPTLVNDMESIEYPNEYDESRNPNWVADLSTYMRTLYAAIRPLSYPIVAPSLTSEKAFQALGDQSSLYDIGNLHNYFSARHPGTKGWGSVNAAGHGYGSILWNLDLAQRAGPGKPVWSTETGYSYDQTRGSNPEDIAGIYMPRLVLEQWLNGIKRTYIYELLDGSSQPFGLIRGDGTPRPAFVAIKNLLNLLKDGGGDFPLDSLSYKLDGNVANVHHLLLQKRDGTFLLSLWAEVPSWDPNKGQYVPVIPKIAELTVTSKRIQRIHQFEPDGHVSIQPATGSLAHLQITDKLMIVEVK